VTATGATLAVGAAHWDVIGRVAGALPPGADAPGLVERRPGGVALNVALALARLGRPAALLAPVGDDAEGAALLAAARAGGVDTRPSLVCPGPTDVYLAIEAGGGLAAAVADCRRIEAAAAEMVAALAAARWDGAAVLDGNLPAPALAAAAQRLDPRRLVLVPASPAKAPRLLGVLAATGAALVCNLAEAKALGCAEAGAAGPAARALVALGARRALVSDGAGPAALGDREGGFAEARPPALLPASVTGAGDALAAAFVAGEQAGLADPALLLASALDGAAAHLRSAHIRAAS